MIKWLSAAVAAWLSLSAAWAATPLNMLEIAPGVFVHQGTQAFPDAHNRDEIANIGFVVGARCVAVIDTGGNPDQGAALLAAVQQATPKPICYVINTHVHPDHVLGNAAFKSTGAVFVGHHKLPAALAARAPYYLQTAQRDWGLALDSNAVLPPSQIVKERLELDLGQRTLLLVAHRSAHTDNDLSIYDPLSQTLWLSDLLFVEHVPTLDGNLLGWLAVLDEIATWPAKQVVPGHGPVQTHWPQALQPERRYLTTLRDEIRRFIQQGRSLEAAMAEVGQSLRAEWPLFDAYHKRNVSTAFAQLEWEN